MADIKSGKSVPANFDWVNARAKCSLQEVFKELEQGVRVDVEAANGLVSAGDALRFSVTKSFPKHFTVNRIEDPYKVQGQGYRLHLVRQHNRSSQPKQRSVIYGFSDP